MSHVGRCSRALRDQNLDVDEKEKPIELPFLSTIGQGRHQEIFQGRPRLLAKNIVSVFWAPKVNTKILHSPLLRPCRRRIAGVLARWNMTIGDTSGWLSGWRLVSRRHQPFLLGRLCWLSVDRVVVCARMIVIVECTLPRYLKIFKNKTTLNAIKHFASFLPFSVDLLPWNITLCLIAGIF